LEQRHGLRLSRKTAWLVLKRRGVWQRADSEKQAVPRFERAQPNELWQIDLIEREPTAIGEVYGIPILDDHSRYLAGLRFFLTKGAETALLTTYLAMRENGTPAEILCDRGGQFVDATGAGTTQFQDVLASLGIKLTVAARAQTKGKEERLNQFIERDFLDEVRWDITSVADLNQRGEAWRQRYNQSHVNETTWCIPARRYRPGLRVDPQSLRQLFAVEERRKVSREATISYRSRQFKVPEKYIGWSVWVSNFFDHEIEIRAGSRILGTFELTTPGDNKV
jgi:Integrase core domain